MSDLSKSEAIAAQLFEWLTGEFQNQVQAQNQPTWFVHLRLWQRAIPQGIQGQRAIFAEQANALYLDQPYRQRILVIQPEPLQIHYWACKAPSQWARAGMAPSRLQGLGESDLDPLPGCVLTVEYSDQGFHAILPATSRCCFEYQGQERQVVLGFRVTAEKFWSYDRGVDPVTGQGLWGALMGPYEFELVNIN